MQGPIVQGWCPSALRPMLSGDGWLVRVNPPGGRLSRDAAEGIAKLAQAHGNGLIDLSSRANLQIRGVEEAGYPPLIAGLTELGLVDGTAETETGRNIVVTPFWSPGDGTQALASLLADVLRPETAPQLPGKFGFAVDCGTSPVLARVSADIRIERGADGGLICRADGAAKGQRISAGTAAASVLQLAQWFVHSGGVIGGSGRMARHLAAGARLPDAFLEADAQVPPPGQPKPGRVAAGFLVAPVFGQIRAEDLSALADFGALRVTPWRMFLVERTGVVPDVPRLITEPDDPRLRVVACTGAPGCLQALQPTRALASALARTAVPALADDAVLHVSGCAKGCAHPGVAGVTLTAREAGFDLVRGGRAGDKPVMRGLTAEDLVDRPEILAEILERFSVQLDHFGPPSRSQNLVSQLPSPLVPKARLRHDAGEGARVGGGLLQTGLCTTPSRSTSPPSPPLPPSEGEGGSRRDRLSVDTRFSIVTDPTQAELALAEILAEIRAGVR